MKLQFNIGTLIPYIIIAILLIFLMKGCNNHNLNMTEKENLIESLNAEIVTWKDKDSLNHAKIQVIETSNINYFLDLKSKDTVIQELQEEVSKYKGRIKNQGSVTVFNTVTEYDTVFELVDLPEHCAFTQNVKNEFIDATYGINSEDQSFFSLKTYDKFTVVVGEEKVSWFKRKPFVEVVNHNPYSTTRTLRTYQVLQKKKHFGVGFHLGYGIGLDLKPQPQVGFSLQYTLLRF